MNGLELCKHGFLFGLCCGSDGYGPAKRYYGDMSTETKVQVSADLPTESVQNNTLANQIGGDHYVRLGAQPAPYAIANNFNYWESFALKYLTRHRYKNGREDLEKCLDCIHKLIETEYGPTPRNSG